MAFWAHCAGAIRKEFSDKTYTKMHEIETPFTKNKKNQLHKAQPKSTKYSEKPKQFHMTAGTCYGSFSNSFSNTSFHRSLVNDFFDDDNLSNAAVLARSCSRSPTGTQVAGDVDETLIYLWHKCKKFKAL